MADLEISQLIKIVIGVAVIVVVVGGIYLFFKESILTFFKNIFSEKPVEMFFGLIR